MQRNLIEARVLEILGRVEQRQPIEDNRVELKAEWMEAEKVARQIAGHANAARNEPILWIFGADEKAATVPGVGLVEISDWYSQIQSKCDDNVAPDMAGNVAVKWPNSAGDTVTVVAILFQTDLAPYVIKNASGQIAREVPWRQGNATYSAKRMQLLRMLASLQNLPIVELLQAELGWWPNKQSDIPEVIEWGVELTLFLASTTSAPVAIPQWGVEVAFHSPGYVAKTHCTVISFSGCVGSNVKVSQSEMTVNGAGLVKVHAFAYADQMQNTFERQDAIVEVALTPLGVQNPVKIPGMRLLAVSPNPDNGNVGWLSKREINGIDVLAERYVEITIV